MSRALNHFKSNVIAYLALFVALGGTSYAAATLGAGSVGTRQLKNHSVTPVKLQKGSIAGYVRDWAQVDENGHVTASRPRAHIVDWTKSWDRSPGGVVSWGRPIPTRMLRARHYYASFADGAASASAHVLSAGNKTGRFVGVQVRVVCSADSGERSGHLPAAVTHRCTRVTCIRRLSCHWLLRAAS